MLEKIKFNAKTHIYTKNGIKYDSVSSILEKYFSKFDMDKVAKFKALRSRQEGIKGQGIRYWKALWKKNREYGTLVHDNIRLCIQMSPFCIPLLYPETNHALKYLHNFEKNISEPFTMSEVILYNDEYKIAGTADIIIYEPDNNAMYIIDWKVVNEIKTESYQDKQSKLGMPDSNFWKYCVQLNLYAWMLRCNGYVTPSMKLVQLTSNGVKEFNVPGMIEEINKILEDRK